MRTKGSYELRPGGGRGVGGGPEGGHRLEARHGGADLADQRDRLGEHLAVRAHPRVPRLRRAPPQGRRPFELF